MQRLAMRVVRLVGVLPEPWAKSVCSSERGLGAANCGEGAGGADRLHRVQVLSVFSVSWVDSKHFRLCMRLESHPSSQAVETLPVKLNL